MRDERSKKLYDGITHIDDELVEEAQARVPNHRPWLRWAAAAACLCLIVTGVLLARRPAANSPNNTGPIPALVAAEAHYPEMAPYPGENASDKEQEAWFDSLQAQRNQPEGYADGLDAFFTASARQLLSGADGENRVCSPLNVYMALAMLAETAGGESRQQILELLGADSIDTLRAQAKAVWNASYRDDGVNVVHLANSLWLRDDMDYVQSTADTLAENYYASSYRGKMGSEAFDNALQVWLNSQTNDLLTQQASGVHLNPTTVLALASAIYFKAPWSDSFDPDNTSADVFHAPEQDLTRDFMHRTWLGSVYRGDGFAAVELALLDSGSMWLLLPDEGVTPDELLAGDAVSFLLSDKWDEEADDRAEPGTYIINLSLPKFDVASDLDLADGLQALGVTDVFYPGAADFSPLTDAEGVCLYRAKHAARVTADEDGVEAAAFTVLIADGEAPSTPEEYDFNLDRPFLFAITGTDGLPLFMGVVNEP